MKNWELVNFCEYDEKVSSMYSSIHNEDSNKNLGDITKVDETKLEDFNFICGGSPCQDFSIAGHQNGSVWTCKECGNEYNPITQHYSKRDCCPNCGSKEINKSRSSLLVEWLRIIRYNMPNFGLYENVKNITCGKHRATFDLFIKELNEYGYNTYWKVLKATDFNVPQERERVFVFIVKQELDNKKFEFPTPIVRTKSVYDLIDSKVDNSYYHICPSMIRAIEDKKCKMIERGGTSNTVTTKQNRWNNAGFVYGENNEKRFFTEKETFRLMGFNDSHYELAKKAIPNKDKLYYVCGNSIVVDVIFELYKEIYKSMPYLFDDLKVSSYFSGIGAFEVALNRLYDEVINN